MLNKIKEFVSYLLSFASDFGPYQKLGFRATTFNSDFILVRDYKELDLRLSLHLGVEPHHPHFGALDFKIPDACLIVRSSHSYGWLNDLLKLHFEHVKVSGPYTFAFTKDLDLDDDKMKMAVSEISARVESHCSQAKCGQS